ncbi:hypothetical protein FHG87_015977 [Trinorchestia longiramus]|nr:hypothetical protein FHG87_015977 [Trinorchestia longiramus]
MANIMLGEKTEVKLSQIPLSNDTISDRIEGMSKDILAKVVADLISSPAKFSLQLDEATDVSNLSQLAVLVRYVKDDVINEDFLFCKPLTVDEPLTSSNAVSSTLTMKREDEVCAGARSEHAGADDKLQEGSSGACNTSAVHQRSAVASQVDLVSLQVSGAVRNDRYQQNCQVPAEVSDTNRDVEIKPGRCQKFLYEFCDYSTNQKYDPTIHLTRWDKLGVLLEYRMTDFCFLCSAVGCELSSGDESSYGDVDFGRL